MRMSRSPPQLLPDVLLFEILSWLPAKTVIRLRRLSKSLNSGTRSPAFALLHLSRLDQREQEQKGKPPRAFFRFMGDRDDRRAHWRELKSYGCVASAGGLVVVRNRHTKFWDSRPPLPRMVLCNPLTGDLAELPQHDPRTVWVGLGFLPRAQEYKVVMLLDKPVQVLRGVPLENPYSTGIVISNSRDV